MPVQLLSTKLSIPPLRSRLIARPRLIQKLNQGFECGFVLVSAPAGYGKTTLLTAWLDQVDFTAAWLSLDEGDNDPARFLAYLAAALRTINPSIGKNMEIPPQASPLPAIETLLTPLVNDIAQHGEPFCLVLDDFHVIQNQTVHQVIAFLVEHRPRPMHLAIATRADPPLALARLRARSEMLEIRQADLRFTDQEASDFLSHTMGLKISPSDVARISRRIEGWIAGLQMAALSIQHTNDLSGFISTFMGRDQYILEYLLEEILGKQSPEIRQFLLFTSILDRLTAPLCDALLAEEAASLSTRSASIILRELEHANLFIVPLDHEHCYYRYHALFAELLRRYLQQNYAGQLTILHTRASHWFEAQEFIPEAIHHALAASDLERVVRLISANIFALLEQNELSAVERQLENLTHEKVSARPWLSIGRAWLAAYTGQLCFVESILEKLETEISSLDSEYELQMFGGHIAAIRAYTAWIEDKRDIAARSARVALEWLPETERLIRCQAATLLGLSVDDFSESIQAHKLSLVYAREIEVSHVSIYAHACWAFMLLSEGRLREAYSACTDALELAQLRTSHQPLPTLSHIYVILSTVLWEWNDLEGALRYGRQAVDLARRWEQADALHFAYENLGTVLFATGDVEEAFIVHHQAWQIAHRTSAWFEESTIAQEVEWYLAQDNLEAALQRLRLAQIDIEELNRIPFIKPHFRQLPLTLVQIHIAQKQYDKALTLVTYLIEELRKRVSGYQLVRVLIWQALAFQGLRQEPQALASLKSALTLAAPEGYLRSFIEVGTKLIPLLHQARLAGIMPDYVSKLLSFVERGDQVQPPEVGGVTLLIEPLSGRELEVLKLLSQGCTDKQIAEILVISQGTVHKHLKNIYEKLNVHSRTAAVARGRELKLL